MLVPVEWLHDYVDFDWSAEALAERLTNVGLEVEEIRSSGRQIDRLVYGRVLEVRDHPNADRLHVCRVDVGEGVAEIVCGAPNVAAGQTVTVALPGAVLPGNFEITERSLRGVQSAGMICSASELALPGDSSGIMVHAAPQIPGTPVLLEDGTGGKVLSVYIFPNRPDLMSIFGIARETAALAGAALKRPSLHNIKESDESIEDRVGLLVRNRIDCPRYAARLVRNVSIGPSPDWMQQRLNAAGVRPINNIVDITNYVLLETGQPLHAFDLSLLREERIVVRSAKSAEKIITLDGVERTLDEADLLICDGKGPVAIAGVMGGENSGVTDATRDILIESAHFRPACIRRTSRRIGLSSEASRRFERGVDPQGVLYAADRAAALMAELAGGAVSRGFLDRNYVSARPRKVTLRPRRVNALLGAEIPVETMVAVLERLECQVKGGNTFSVTIPPFRFDLEREADLIEEIGRYFGYDHVASRLSAPAPLVNALVNPYHASLDRLRNLLMGLGLQEVRTGTFTQGLTGVFDEADLKPVRIANPLNDELAFLRTSLTPGLLTTAQFNLNHGRQNIRLFEFGHVFHPGNNGSGAPEETRMLAGLIQGTQQAAHWTGDIKDIDFFSLKGLLESFFRNISLDNYDFNEYANRRIPVGCVIRIHGAVCGYAGMLAAGELDTATGKQCGLFELKIDPILKHLSERRVTYQAISRFPRVLRDVALVVDETCPADLLMRTIRREAGDALRLLEVFDVYRGTPVPAGRKSMGFRCEFGSSERTLTETDVDHLMRRLLEAVSRDCGAVLREQ